MKIKTKDQKDNVLINSLALGQCFRTNPTTRSMYMRIKHIDHLYKTATMTKIVDLETGVFQNVELNMVVYPCEIEAVEK